MQLKLGLSNYTKNCKWSRKEAWCRLVSTRLWLLEGAQRSWVQPLYIYKWILQSSCQRHKPKKASVAPKAKALAEFLKRFPKANMRQFTRSRIQGLPGLAAKSRRGWWKNWGRALRVALLVGNSYQLKLTKNVKQPVPAVDFANNIARVDGLFNQEQNMHVTPIEYFTSSYREIFTNTKHVLDKERGKGTARWTKHEI